MTSDLYDRALNKLFRSIPPSIRVKTRVQYYRSKGYTALGDPLGLYNINPREITAAIPSRKLPRRTPIFGIWGGDWDTKAVDNEVEGTIYDMFYERFVEDKPWSETRRFNQVSELMKEDRDLSKYNPKEESVSKYMDYLRTMDELYRDIDENGYKTQREIRGEGSFFSIPELNEVQVFIGRRGKLICKSGAHRLAMAKILDIDEVPVRTQVRHKEWQRLREMMDTSNGGTPPMEFILHPEVQELQ